MKAEVKEFTKEFEQRKPEYIRDVTFVRVHEDVAWICISLSDRDWMHSSSTIHGESLEFTIWHGEEICGEVILIAETDEEKEILGWNRSDASEKDDMRIVLNRHPKRGEHKFIMTPIWKKV